MKKRHLTSFALGATILFAGAIALRVRQVARRSAQASDAEGSAAAYRTGRPLEIIETAYQGKLGKGWQDWGWGPHELPNAGAARIVFAGYGGIVLHHAPINANFGGVSLRYKAPSGWPDFLSIALKHAGSADKEFPLVSIGPRHLVKTENGWREVFVDWRELDPSNLPIDRLVIAARLPVGQDWVELDRIGFTKSDGGKTGPAPSRDVELAVECDAPTHPISPLIYGAADGSWESGQSAQRLGGNPLTRLNWDGGWWNSANDWFFENGKSNGTVWEWIDAGVAHGAETAATVPMIGWVAKDSSSVGFPRAKFEKQRKFDPNRAQAGDGVRMDGSKIQPGPPTETSIPAGPDVIGRWVRTVREKDRARGSRAVQMYILDNEPSLWSTTHRDVHPDPVSYDELLDRSIRYASEIRSSDPEALIAGPAEWGWNGYLFSGKDQAVGISQRPDRLAHGDVPLVAWYLQKMAEHEHSSGVRLLDVLDLHFYPAAAGLYGQNARVDPEGAELRVRATRALWDPTYQDESWIKEPIRLIPRMKEWVARNYPGRKISLGEWSFGADDHISGGLATAEALGRFGQQGLDSAFYWAGPKAKTATFWAFRAYRNFDGAGGRFLDTSLKTSEDEKVSLFASRDESGTHLVLVAVNRDPQYAAAARINTGLCGTPTSRRIFGYSSGSSALAEAPSSDATGRVVIPPFSFVVIDLRVKRATRD